MRRPYSEDEMSLADFWKLDGVSNFLVHVKSFHLFNSIT